jgi:two-component system, OmpR family, alkaline phosphatase synthesis response regulator PhoP
MTTQKRPQKHLPSSPARALLVIDQPLLAGVVEMALNHGTYTTRVASSAPEALEEVKEWQPHLAVLDMDINDGKGMQCLEEIRSWSEPIPVVALTRRGDLKTKLAAFERGVDDILTVPFPPEELVARSLAVMRRTYGAVGVFAPVLKLGELEVDILSRSVKIGGHELHLTSLEQNLLYLLAANAGRLLTRDEILDYLWGSDYAAESNVVDRHIRNLRAKLQNDWRRPRYIVTVPGQGYQFSPVTAT